MTSPSNLQLIIDALSHYSSLTGTDLSENPFAEKLQLSNSPDAILELLHEREKAFKEYRDGHRGLIKCLSPAVRVLHAFSATLGEALSLVSPPSSFPCPFPSECFDSMSSGPLPTSESCLSRH
jgi:hypothetical protein